MELKTAFIVTALCLSAVEARPEVTETLEEFEKEFNILVPSSYAAEEAARLQEAEDQINAENEKFANGEATYGEKLNDFSDLPKDEFEKEKEGLVMPDSSRFVGDRINGIFLPPPELRSSPENDAKLKALYDAIDREAVPDTYDSTTLGLVTTAKNQKSCGSCAAFAATSLHETCMLKAGAKKEGLDLSEQFLVDCGFNTNSMNACNGAYPDAYTDWFATTGAGSAPHEGSMPYLDRNPKLTCPSDVKKWGSGAVMKNAVKDYQCNADKLKQLVSTHGAVLVGVYASDSGFSNYATGVFQGCSSTAANHAVVVVGYGVENGLDYWLVKNSWGNGWGANGFIKIKRGSNECGIENICVTGTCEASGTTDPIPTTPKPAPVPPNLQCDISKLFGTSGITGSYNLRVGTANGLITSKVKCENSVCSPRIAGPSNACMYICGQLQC